MWLNLTGRPEGGLFICVYMRPASQWVVSLCEAGFAVRRVFCRASLPSGELDGALYHLSLRVGFLLRRVAGGL